MEVDTSDFGRRVRGGDTKLENYEHAPKFADFAFTNRVTDEHGFSR